ncbi:hypothetical protein CsSME_00041425 [Camellia sinensis var. sinensis]
MGIGAVSVHSALACLQILDTKDRRIQELTLELERQDQLCDLYREQIITFLKKVEEQTEVLSTKIQDVYPTLRTTISLCSKTKLKNEEQRWCFHFCNTASFDGGLSGKLASIKVDKADVAEVVNGKKSVAYHASVPIPRNGTICSLRAGIKGPNTIRAPRVGIKGPTNRASHMLIVSAI